MGAGEEIDLTGLAQVIERVTKEIKNLSTETKVAEQYIMGLGDKKAEAQLKTLQTAISGMDSSVKGMIESMRGGKGGINAFLENLTKFRESLKSTEGIAPPVTGLMESLNKLTSGYKAFHSVLAEGMRKSTTETSSLLKLVEKFPITFDLIIKDYQRINKLAEEKSLREKENAEWAEKNASALYKQRQYSQPKAKYDKTALTYQQHMNNLLKEGKSAGIAYYLKTEKSIERINNVLGILRSQQERCNLATKEGRQRYAELGKQAKALEFILGRNVTMAQRLQGVFQKTKGAAEQIAMSFGVMTGVFGATNFIKQLYKITAEFQLQQRALGAIIKNTREANVLFKQMQSLAVESPMKFMDLNKYAKQLAAFRIETSQLFDSLKMLGDISVGVGVDMDRLILAYGQVKAANYLRGQELRQFSEAGVNILGGLQEYYRETKNINLSINEIFDSVSKRKVLFEDVDAVLHKMTESGGEFYNMQLIQSQTLYGQLQKLGDLFQISMNQIGESTSGILLVLIQGIQFFIKHLREVIALMVAWGSAKFLGGLIAKIITINSGLKLMGLNFTQAIKLSRTLGKANGMMGLVSGLGAAALKANLLTIGLQAAAMALGFFLARAAEQKAKRESLINGLVEELNEYNRRLFDIREIENRFWSEKDSPLYKDKLIALQNLIEKSKEYQITLQSVNQDITPSNINEVFANASNELENYIQKVKEYKAALSTPEGEKAAENWSKINVEFATAAGNAEDLYKYYKANYDALSEEQKQIVDYIDTVNTAIATKDEETLKQLNETTEGWKKGFIERINMLQQYKEAVYDAAMAQGGGQGFEYEPIYAGDETEKKFQRIRMQNVKKFLEDYEKAFQESKEQIETDLTAAGVNLADLIDPNSGKYIKEKVEGMLPALKDAVKEWPDYLKEQLPDLISSIVGGDPNELHRILLELDLVKSNAMNTEFQNFLEKIVESPESGFKKTMQVELSFVDRHGREITGTPEQLQEKGFISEELRKQYENTMQIAEAAQKAAGSEKDKRKAAEDAVKLYREQLKMVMLALASGKNQKTVLEGINAQLHTSFKTLGGLKLYIEQILENGKTLFDLSSWEWPKDKTTHGRTQSMKSEYQSMIDFVRELNREFDTLRKNFNEKDSAKWAGATNRILSSFEAKFGAMPTKFKKAFQNTLRSIDFTTKEGTVEAENIVKGLIDSAKDLTKKEKDELQRAWGEAVGQIKLEAELELKAREDERLKAKVQKMFDDYNLTIELKKMQINVDEVTDLFGITKRNLSEIEQKLIDMREDFIGQNMEKEYRQYWRKLQEIQDKANLEMSKKYLKYLRNEYSERAKIELDYMKQRAEIYALPFDEDETMRILENLRKETDEKLAKIDWDEFRATDYYIEMFEDLETVSSRSINTMISKLDEMKSSLKGLSPTELKTMTEQIQKLKDELVDRNPFKALAESMKELRSMKTDANFTTLIAKYLGEGEEGDQKLRSFSRRVDRAIDIVEQKISENQSKINILEPLIDAAKTKQQDIESLNIPVDIDISQVNEKISQLDRQIERFSIGGDDIAESEYMQQRQQEVQKMIEERQLYAEILSMMQQIEESGAKIGVSSSMSVAELLELWQNLTNEVKTYTNDVGNIKKAQKELTKQQKALVKMSELFKQIAESSKQTFDSIMDNLDYLGGATDEVTDAWKDFGDAIFDTITGALGMIPTLVAGFTTAGLEINAAMGIIGLIAEAIQLVITLITALAKVHDARIEKKIQNIQKSCDKLKKTIDELTEAFDNLYNEDKLRQFDAAIIKSRELYIANLNAMIDAERQKKKVDQEQIDGWLDEIDDANKEMQEGIENFYEALGGFGSAANMKSTVEEWTNAWYNAFKETGDGLSGLEDSFEEFFENIVKKTLMNNIMAKYFGEDFLASLDTILGTEGGVMGNLDALNDWINQYHELAVQADEEMQAATQAIQSVTGIGGGLEGMQASLQGMTEETADILAAYLNSVRFYVADNNQLLQNLLNGLTIDNNSNPMLQQLKIVAAQTTSINLLLDSVVHSGGYQGNGGGSYLKVHAILES